MKLIWTLLFFSLSFSSLAVVKIEDIHVKCGQSSECINITENFNTLDRSYVDYKHLDTILKLYTLNSGIKNFNYYVSNNVLHINLIPKMKVKSLLIESSNIELPSLLPIKEDDYYDYNKIEKTKEIISTLYKNKGYPDVKVTSKIDISNNLVSISLNVDEGQPIIVDKVNISSNSKLIFGLINRKLSIFNKSPFNIQSIKAQMDEVKQLLIGYGYYLIDLQLKYTLENYKVELFVEVSKQTQHLYKVDISNNDEHVLNIKNLLKTSIISYKRVLSDDLLKQFVVEYFEKRGYLDSKVSIKEANLKTIIGDDALMKTISIEIGNRSYLEELEFKGNNIITDEELISLFYKAANGQVKSGILDKTYYIDFLSLIKEEYVKKGYVNVFIDNPEILIKPVSKNISLTYRIREGVKALVKSIRLKNISEKEKKSIEKLIKTKVGEGFNPIQFKKDIISINTYLKNEGYYFASITNINNSNLVKYTKDNSRVNINVVFNLGKQYYVNDIIIVGNHKTRSKLILREINLTRNQKVTSKSITASQTNLLTTGLFSSVAITPVRNQTNKADILISLKEKDFGVIELAPGVRTDLGPKLSGNISYNNIDGLNKQLSFKGQINKRMNLNSLDETRREESQSLVEYLALVNYSEKYLFDKDWSLGLSLSQSRKRYFSFDADIQKTSYTLGTDITDWLKFNFTQQLETISQYDTTIDREHGHFQIGSVTPELTFDFRNDRINPTKGAYFNLSYELASPSFLSQSNDELVIDYYKITSRNRFYVPFHNGVLALSLSAGWQKNRAQSLKINDDGSTETKGYIPNIKVFRLSGMDIVRGFEDDEINRLVTGEDISEARVDSHAYMANIKLEPRFYLSDSTMLGIFYDAGRVFVDSYDLSELRSSVGLSFKYLTPVGSLDFDYGIKLLRKKDNNGRLESPGRLHVSIGFF